MLCCIKKRGGSGAIRSTDTPAILLVFLPVIYLSLCHLLDAQQRVPTKCILMHADGINVDDGLDPLRQFGALGDFGQPVAELRHSIRF